MSIPITEQVGQLMVMGISGLSLTNDEKKFIVDNNIGGVILFGRNVTGGPTQVRALCDEIQSLRHLQKSKLPLFIAIDMEGGRVHRLKPPFTQWPAVANLGAIDNSTVSFQFAKSMGAELFACGINLDYAPCLDIFSNPANTVIGDRAIGTDAAIVEKHSSALVRGYIKSNIIPCIKHFPGHGNTLIDSHEELPIEDMDLAALEKREMIPFKKAFRSKAELTMLGHLLFKNIDPEWPVTLSEKFIKEILREGCRYRGIITTDDMDMGALKKNYAKDFLAVKALQAGVDMLLYCNEPDSPKIAVEAIRAGISSSALNVESLEDSFEKIVELKKTINLDLPSIEEMQKIVDDPKSKELAQSIRSRNVDPQLLAKFSAVE